MKFLRRLSRHGGSTHVSIPPQVIAYLRWQPLDGIVLEVTEDDTIELRRVTPADMKETPVQPMTLNTSHAGAR